MFICVIGLFIFMNYVIYKASKVSILCRRGSWVVVNEDHSNVKSVS